MGRPSTFTQETADRICERIADGESLRAICLGDDMPNRCTVFKWCADIETFAVQYTRAREAQAEAMAEDILEIADDSGADMVDMGDGIKVLNSEHVQRSRLRVDARKWLASKMAPKKYGDRITAEHTGKDGGPMIVEIVQFGKDDE